jgi:putative ABC transport system permease protein
MARRLRLRRVGIRISLKRSAGIYSLKTRHLYEIGIRLAMGARAVDVLILVIGQAMPLVAIGAVIGLPASLQLTHMMKTLLFEVSATAPLTFSVAAVLLLLTALLACWAPARRATRVDPMIAMRGE